MEFLSGARKSLNPLSFDTEVNREFLYLLTNTRSGHAYAADKPLHILPNSVPMLKAWQRQIVSVKPERRSPVAPLVLLHTGIRAHKPVGFRRVLRAACERGELCPGCRDWGCVLFFGLTAKLFHTQAIWYRMMNALGIFRIDRLVSEDL
jgi:hypothetical protein